MIRTKTEIIQLLATKYNLPLREITKIVDSQFAVVALTMKAKEYESVRLPMFGVFKVRPESIYNANLHKHKTKVRKHRC
jgi:nucleoid DNA-binding protein